MRTSTRTVLAAATAAGAAAALTLTAPSALAAGATRPHLVGSAAGSTVTALGGAVVSGPTAQSGVDTLSAGQTSSNAIAAASVPGVASTGAISTSSASSAVAGGLSLTSHARTAGLNLLNGAITAKAVDTVATATIANGQVSNTIDTTFVDLRVGGLPIPLTMGRNTTLSIPGVATVTLNYQSAKTGAGSVSASGAGAVITLLSGSLASTVTLNPVSASIDQVGAGYAPLDGYAYAAQVAASVGGQVNVSAGPIGQSSMPRGGTGGKNVTNNTAAVNLPGIATVGAVGSTANGIVGDTASVSKMSARVGTVNLLGGLIKADALTAAAAMRLTAGSKPVATGGTTLVNLVIAGKSIPANAAPNTVITIPGLAKVTINARSHTATSSTVHALDITLTTAALGLPAGAVIEIGVASASFLP